MGLIHERGFFRRGLMAWFGGVVLWGSWLGGHEAAAQKLPPFEPVQVIPRAIRPITNPNVVSAAQAAQVMGDSELVLGVAIGKEARAYPINMLTGPMREIINDRLGDRDIAATW